MSFKCVKCFDTSTHKDDILECSTCKKFLHFYCAGYSEINFKKMSNNTKARFNCTECQTDILKFQKSPKNQKTENKVNSVNPMEKNIEELMSSVSFMSSQFDNFNKKIDTIVSELKNIKLVNEKIIAENKRLSDEVCILKYKIDEIEQHNLGISVDIIGIPKTTNENCIDIVEEIGKITNTECKVIEAYRINSLVSKQNIITAKLSTLGMRKDLIHKVRSMKLTADIIKNNWPKEKIYINERLTKSKRSLFHKLDTLRKKKISNLYGCLMLIFS